MGFLILKMWRDCIPLETSSPFMSPFLSSPPPPAASPPAAQYTMLRLGRGGLRSGRPPLQPRVQLEERRLQRGDFSLWLRPAQRADAGLYHATVYLRDRDRPVTCRLRLRLGQASSRWGWGRGEGRGLGAGRRVPDAGPRAGRAGPGLCF